MTLMNSKWVTQKDSASSESFGSVTDQYLILRASVHHLEFSPLGNECSKPCESYSHPKSCRSKPVWSSVKHKGRSLAECCHSDHHCQTPEMIKKHHKRSPCDLCESFHRCKSLILCVYSNLVRFSLDNLHFLTSDDLFLIIFGAWQPQVSIDFTVWKRTAWTLCVGVVVSRRQSEYGGVVFGGWARMAQTIVSFSIVEVAKPNIGENWPARVRADITLNLNIRDHIKNEWEGKQLFLCKTTQN